MKTFEEAVDEILKEEGARWVPTVQEASTNDKAKRIILMVESQQRPMLEASSAFLQCGEIGRTTRQTILNFALACFAIGVAVGGEMEKSE